MTTMTDTIEDRLRDYVTAGNPASGDYEPDIADLRDDILVPMALFQHTISEVAAFNLAADLATALSEIGLGASDDVTFGSVTAGDAVFDTNVLVVDATNNRVGIGTASPATGLSVAVAAAFASTLAVTGAVTLTADLTVDTSTFKVDSTNNRVGVGTASPGVTFDAVGEGRVTSASASTPALRVVQTGSAPAMLVEDAASTDGTPWTILADGTVVAGYTASVAGPGAITGLSQVHAAGAAAAQAVFRWSADGAGAYLTLGKSRSATIGSRAAVNSGDVLGYVSFGGDDGTNFIRGALIQAAVDGTPGTNDMPGRLVFLTTPDGSDTPSERLRIAQDGFLSFGGDTDTGIELPGDGELAFSTAGVEALRILDNQRVIFGYTDSVPVKRDSATISAAIQNHGTTGNTAALTCINWSTSAASDAILTLAKSKSGTIGTQGVVANGDTVGTLVFSADDGTAFITAAMIQCDIAATPGTNDMPGRLGFYTTPDGAASPTLKWQITPTGTFAPGTDNAYGLGSASLRSSVVYSATSTIQTSDATEKVLRGGLSEAEKAAALVIAGQIGAYKWKDAVAEKGDAARTHIGPTAQSVAAAMSAQGLDPATYALWCADAVVDKDGHAKVRQGLRMDQAILLLAASFHERISALEAA